MLDVVHNRPVRTIVLELDNVLIHTEWDRENGWRFKYVCVSERTLREATNS